MDDKITISAEVAELLHECQFGIDYTNTELDGWTFVAINEGESGRWDQYMSLIASKHGAFYAYDFSVGLTENQPNSFPWKNDWGESAKTVAMYRVYPTVKTITTWTTKPPLGP